MGNQPSTDLVYQIHVQGMDLASLQQWLSVFLQRSSAPTKQIDKNGRDEGIGKSAPPNGGNSDHEDLQLESLAWLVHRKTSGNPYFVLQLMNQLEETNVLSYNFLKGHWEWDMNQVESSTKLADNVVDVVKLRIHSSLPLLSRHILKLAACLGYFVDLRVLESLVRLMVLPGEMKGEDSRPQSEEDNQVKNDKINGVKTSSAQPTPFVTRQMFQSVIDEAVNDALIEHVGGGIIKFSHDRIQQCLYKLIETNDAREQMHFDIGQHLKHRHQNYAPSSTGSNITSASSAAEEDTDSDEARYLFLSVDQLNRAPSLVAMEQSRMLDLIQLNLDASEVAKRRGAIESASSFLHKAMKLVQPHFWLYHYSTILEVHNALAEMEFSLGRIETSEAIVQQIHEHAVRDHDKVRADMVTFQILGMQAKFAEALRMGRQILANLGEPVPKATIWNILKEYFQTRRMTKNQSDEYFIKLPPTNSFRVQTILKIFKVGAVYAYNLNVPDAGIFCLRGMQVSMREGWTECTPNMYSGFGFLQSNFGQGNDGYRFCQLALSKSFDKKIYPTVVPYSYCLVLHHQLPLNVGIEPLLSGYRVGLETGDMFFGTICIACYIVLYLQCGLPLKPFIADQRNFCSQLKICRQDIPFAFICPCLQLALNLTGQSDDVRDLSRDSIKRNQEYFSENVLAVEEHQPVLYMWYLQVFNSFLLEDLNTVETVLKRIHKRKETRLEATHILNYFSNLWMDWQECDYGREDSVVSVGR